MTDPVVHHGTVIVNALPENTSVQVFLPLKFTCEKSLFLLAHWPLKVGKSVDQVPLETLQEINGTPMLRIVVVVVVVVVVTAVILAKRVSDA